MAFQRRNINDSNDLPFDITASALTTKEAIDQKGSVNVLIMSTTGGDGSDLKTLIDNSNPTESEPVTINIAPGRYNISETVYFKEWIDVVGSGEEATIFYNTGNINMFDLSCGNCSLSKVGFESSVTDTTKSVITIMDGETPITTSTTGAFVDNSGTYNKINDTSKFADVEQFDIVIITDSPNNTLNGYMFIVNSVIDSSNITLFGGGVGQAVSPISYEIYRLTSTSNPGTDGVSKKVFYTKSNTAFTNADVNDILVVYNGNEFEIAKITEKLDSDTKLVLDSTYDLSFSSKINYQIYGVSSTEIIYYGKDGDGYSAGGMNNRVYSASDITTGVTTDSDAITISGIGSFLITETGYDVTYGYYVGWNSTDFTFSADQTVTFMIIASTYISVVGGDTNGILGWNFAGIMASAIWSGGSQTTIERSKMLDTITIGSAPWTGRYGHTSVVYDNKMWVIGGYDVNSNYKNDVWYSTDGVNWTQATSSAAWPARYHHTSVVYDNKMWVISGYVSNVGNSNDVWYSTDGVNWTEATSSAAWASRYLHTSVVYDNKMWVMGGYVCNDVWYSTDGVNWTEATSSAAWYKRYYHKSVVYDNKMWVMGGIAYDGYGYSSVTDVWYSTDGVNWTQATSAGLWAGKYGFSSIVYDNKMWIVGGYFYYFKPDYTPFILMWYSTDGVNWTRHIEMGSYFPLFSFTLIEYDSNFWIIGGSTGLGYLSTVSNSSNMTDWNIVTTANYLIFSTPWWWDTKQTTYSRIGLPIKKVDQNSLVFVNPFDKNKSMFDSKDAFVDEEGRIYPYETFIFAREYEYTSNTGEFSSPNIFTDTNAAFSGLSLAAGDIIIFNTSDSDYIWTFRIISSIDSDTQITFLAEPDDINPALSKTTGSSLPYYIIKTNRTASTYLNKSYPLYPNGWQQQFPGICGCIYTYTHNLASIAMIDQSSLSSPGSAYPYCEFSDNILDGTGYYPQRTGICYNIKKNVFISNGAFTTDVTTFSYNNKIYTIKERISDNIVYTNETIEFEDLLSTLEPVVTVKSIYSGSDGIYGDLMEFTSASSPFGSVSVGDYLGVIDKGLWEISTVVSSGTLYVKAQPGGAISETSLVFNCVQGGGIGDITLKDINIYSNGNAYLIYYYRAPLRYIKTRVLCYNMEFYSDNVSSLHNSLAYLENNKYNQVYGNRKAPQFLFSNLNIIANVYRATSNNRAVIEIEGTVDTFYKNNVTMDMNYGNGWRFIKATNAGEIICTGLLTYKHVDEEYNQSNDFVFDIKQYCDWGRTSLTATKPTYLELNRSNCFTEYGGIVKVSYENYITDGTGGEITSTKVFTKTGSFNDVIAGDYLIITGSGVNAGWYKIISTTSDTVTIEDQFISTTTDYQTLSFKVHAMNYSNMQITLYNNSFDIQSGATSSESIVQLELEGEEGTGIVLANNVFSTYNSPEIKPLGVSTDRVIAGTVTVTNNSNIFNTELKNDPRIILV